MFVDTNLSYASNNIYEINLNLNKDLANVSEWLSANKVTLNQTKTEFMLIVSRERINTFQSTPLLTINNVLLKRVSHTKSLCMHSDENLSWNVHNEKLSKKVASGLMFLFPQYNGFIIAQFSHISTTALSSGIGAVVI